MTFCAVPVGFVYRDDWPDPSCNTAMNIFHDKVVINHGLTSYMSGTLDQRNTIYKDVLDTLWSIGKEGATVGDEEVLEEVQELLYR